MSSVWCDRWSYNTSRLLTGRLVEVVGELELELQLVAGAGLKSRHQRRTSEKLTTSSASGRPVKVSSALSVRCY